MSSNKYIEKYKTFCYRVGKKDSKMKICYRCKLEKSFESYTKEKQKKDGFCSYCKDCLKIIRKEINERISDESKNKLKVYAEKYREENRQKINEKAREAFWLDRERRLEKNRECYYKHKISISIRRKEKRSDELGKIKENLRQKEWRTKNPQLYRSYVKRWQKTNKEKHNSHQKVHTAIKNGTLVRRENCEECGKECKTEGHHEDYNKPLDVIWICRRCHAKKIEIVGV
jgi:hypothetical protein